MQHFETNTPTLSKPSMSMFNHMQHVSLWCFRHLQQRFIDRLLQKHITWVFNVYLKPQFWPCFLVVSVGWLPNDYIRNGWLSSSWYSIVVDPKNDLILTKTIGSWRCWRLPSWWLNQPTWKICGSQIGWFPPVGVNIKNMAKPPPNSKSSGHFLSSFLDLLKMLRKGKTSPQMDPNGGLMVILNGRNPWAMTN